MLLTYLLNELHTRRMYPRYLEGFWSYPHTFDVSRPGSLPRITYSRKLDFARDYDLFGLNQISLRYFCII